jgi:hypothetical protein
LIRRLEHSQGLCGPLTLGRKKQIGAAKRWP